MSPLKSVADVLLTHTHASIRVRVSSQPVVWAIQRTKTSAKKIVTEQTGSSLVCHFWPFTAFGFLLTVAGAKPNKCFSLFPLRWDVMAVPLFVNDTNPACVHVSLYGTAIMNDDAYVRHKLLTDTILAFAETVYYVSFSLNI